MVHSILLSLFIHLTVLNFYLNLCFEQGWFRNPCMFSCSGKCLTAKHNSGLTCSRCLCQSSYPPHGRWHSCLSASIESQALPCSSRHPSLNSLFTAILQMNNFLNCLTHFVFHTPNHNAQCCLNTRLVVFLWGLLLSFSYSVVSDSLRLQGL